MTWSILARDGKTGEFGVCIATKAFAVGAICPHGHGQYGLIATQAKTNPMFGGRGIRLLADDYPADRVVAMLLASDDGRQMRQLHVMDRWGHVAQHTGTDCVEWCGSAQGERVSVAGNMLAGGGVVDKTLDVYLANAGLPLPIRLMTAMEAGEAAGGDKRGKQSASLRIWRGEEYTFLDMRVDDHIDPLAELRRLHECAQERYVLQRLEFPTAAHPSGRS